MKIVFSKTFQTPNLPVQYNTAIIYGDNSLASDRPSPGLVSCQSFPAHRPSSYMPLRPPNLRAWERAIELLLDDPQRYPRDVKWPFEYIEGSTNSKCSMVIVPDWIHKLSDHIKKCHGVISDQFHDHIW
jgi:hypothetical protein